MVSLCVARAAVVGRALCVPLLFLSVPVALLGVAPRGPVTIHILSISDWHGQLDPFAVAGVGNVGGAAVLSSYWQAERAANPNTLTLTAGDAFGASPPLAALFNEEPAVRALNLMGLDADTFGNHNFDRGLAHLQEMIGLADYPFVSANLSNLDENLTGVAPFTIFDVGGVLVGVIGITNPEAPTLVFPGNFGTMDVTDPIPAANSAKARARAAGAKVIVAITHLGVTGFDPTTGAAVGPLVDFASNVGGFDLIFGDHTDVEFSGVINNALVIENRSRGRTYARTRLVVDPFNGRVLDRAVEFVTPLSSAVTPDPDVVDLLAPYRAALSAAFDTVIGVATDSFPRGANIERLREVALGNLVADAMRLRYGSELALTNAGGLRAPLPSGYLPADHTLRRTTAGYAAGPPYDLVAGDVFSVLPFGNIIVTRTVTGAQLHAALENSVAFIPAANGRFAQISGFRFSYDSSQLAGSRVVLVALDDGTPILPDGTSYTIAVNDFINAGGDGYTMLVDGQGVSREVLADVVMAYIQSLGVITPTIEGRITNLAP